MSEGNICSYNRAKPRGVSKGNNSCCYKLWCPSAQGSVLGPLLFLLYMTDLNRAIKFCKVHHFADDTNLLCL